MGSREEGWTHETYLRAMSRMQFIELKAGRALAHLEALKSELQTYYDSKPCTVTKFSKPDIGRRGLRIELQDPSDTIYLLAGDFAHNLRCTLDHVVYALIVHNTKNLPDSAQVQWPIQIKQDDSSFERQTKGVPAQAADIIKSLQPYHDGPGDAYKQNPIWQLHKLDIVDKHRRIAINEHAIQSYFPTGSKVPGFLAEIVEHGWEVSYPIDAPVVPMEYDPRPEILFGDSDEGLFVSTERLSTIYDCVTKQVLPRFSFYLV
jgi:hypothetical protein